MLEQPWALQMAEEHWAHIGMTLKEVSQMSLMDAMIAFLWQLAVRNPEKQYKDEEFVMYLLGKLARRANRASQKYVCGDGAGPVRAVRAVWVPNG